MDSCIDDAGTLELEELGRNHSLLGAAVAPDAATEGMVEDGSPVRLDFVAVKAAVDTNL